MGENVALLGFFVLFVVGYFAGRSAEARHYRSINSREKKLLHIPALTMKSGCSPERVEDSCLVTGSVVVSVDYFKRVVAALRNIVGGQVSAYESLIDRARREAMLRMKAEADDADMIVNVRIETASIGISAETQGTVGSVEALCYGTAVWLKPLH